MADELVIIHKRGKKIEGFSFLRLLGTYFVFVDYALYYQKSILILEFLFFIIYFTKYFLVADYQHFIQLISLIKISQKCKQTIFNI